MAMLHSDKRSVTRVDDAVRALLNDLPAMFFTADAGGLVDWVSTHFCTLSGLDAAALIGEAWVFAIHPEDAEDAVWRVDRSLETRAPFEVCMRLRHADATYHWYIFRAELVEFSDPPQWFGTAVGINEPARTALATKKSDNA